MEILKNQIQELNSKYKFNSLTEILEESKSEKIYSIPGVIEAGNTLIILDDDDEKINEGKINGE